MNFRPQDGAKIAPKWCQDLAKMTLKIQDCSMSSPRRLQTAAGTLQSLKKKYKLGFFSAFACVTLSKMGLQVAKMHHQRRQKSGPSLGGSGVPDAANLMPRLFFGALLDSMLAPTWLTNRRLTAHRMTSPQIPKRDSIPFLLHLGLEHDFHRLL